MTTAPIKSAPTKSAPTKSSSRFENSSDGEIEAEVIRVTALRVACDGGGGAMGHPRVWLHLGDDHEILCTYCSRHYILAGSAADKMTDE
jgi:uncharacterized Zn-finger protein